jgi:hypothetical protein
MKSPGGCATAPSSPAVYIQQLLHEVFVIPPRPEVLSSLVEQVLSLCFGFVHFEYHLNCPNHQSLHVVDQSSLHAAYLSVHLY